MAGIFFSQTSVIYFRQDLAAVGIIGGVRNSEVLTR